MAPTTRLALLLLASTFASASFARAQAVLLKDIRSGFGSSQPFLGYDLTDVDGTLFFVADDGFTGEELWKSDGTTAGTVLVRDIRFGAADARPEQLTAIGSTVFFRASDGTTGIELWKSDGTVSGTSRVRDINSGSNSSNPSNLTNFDGTLFFTATTSTSGTELWKSDGTLAGTVLVKDIVPGGSSSSPMNLTAWNGRLYFSATTSSTGRELWVSDGTDAGTVLLADLTPGSTGASPSTFTPSGGSLFFVSDTSTTLQKLWKTDGTGAGTVLVRQFPVPSPTAELLYLTDAGGTLFFKVYDAASGRELWKSDGTAAGTMLVADIHASGSSDPVFLLDVSGILYFAATDSSGGGRELWRSDGTSAGTFRVKDIWSGASSGNPLCLVNVNGSILFRANDGTTGLEMWRSDGTDAGTLLLQDINGGGSSFSGGSDCYSVVSNTNVYFAANDGTHGLEIWALPLDDFKYFTVRSTDGQNRLEWINPASGTSVQIRYSTVAPPTNLSEGTALTVPAGTPGAYQAHDHTGLTNDVTYYYTAFVDNGAGAVISRTTKGRPPSAASRVRWVFQSRAAALSPPAIGSVYAPSNDRVLYSMVPGPGGGSWPSGWRPFETPAPVQGRLAVVPVVVGSASKVTFLGSQDGRVYAVDADRGVLAWPSADFGVLQAVPGGEFTRFSGGAYDLVIVGSHNSTGPNGLYGLNLADGSTAWAFVNSLAQSGDDRLMGMVSGQATIDYANHRAFFASRARAGESQKTVWCVSYDDAAASLVWARGLDSPAPIGSVDGSPVIFNGRLYVGTNGGEVYALDPTTGNDLWTAPFATSDGMVKGFVWADPVLGNLYFSTTNTFWSVRDGGSSASENWRVGSIPFPSAPLYLRDASLAYVGSSDGRLYELDVSAGAPTPVPILIGDGGATVGSPSFDVANDILYVGAEDGSIHAVTVP